MLTADLLGKAYLDSLPIVVEMLFALAASVRGNVTSHLFPHINYVEISCMIDPFPGPPNYSQLGNSIAIYTGWNRSHVESSSIQLFISPPYPESISARD